MLNLRDVQTVEDAKNIPLVIDTKFDRKVGFFLKRDGY